MPQSVADVIAEIRMTERAAPPRSGRRGLMGIPEWFAIESNC
jgi:hypothetical protein